MKKNISELLSSNKRKELILISFFACLSSLFLTTTIIFANLYMKITQRKFKAKRFLEEVPQASSDDRYIPVLSNMTEDAGALIYRGKHDINNSKYFKYIDIYNMNSSGSLILLENFKTYQQTSDYSCGIASLIMAVYRINGTILNETDMSIRVGANEENGTLIADLERLVGELGFEYECKTTFNESTNPTRSVESFAEYIKDSLTNNEPIIVLSYDWGGHYSVIIGYDDMGTSDYISDDIIILADPYDTTDHMNDGYTIFNLERYYAQMSLPVFGIKDQDFNFIKIKRKNN